MAATLPGLTQALGGMNRYLAIGYFLTALVILANLMVLRGAVPGLEGVNALIAGQAIMLALIPAAVLLFIGSKRSAGRIRKFIGYALFVFATLGAGSACVAIALLVSGQAQSLAA